MSAKLVLQNVYKVKELNIQHVFSPSLISRKSVTEFQP